MVHMEPKYTSAFEGWGNETQEIKGQIQNDRNNVASLSQRTEYIFPETPFLVQ